MASRGDILTVAVEEIILQDDGSLAWLGPHVVDIDRTRKEPYYAQQVVGMAKRGHILQDARVQQAMPRNDKCMKKGCAKPPEKWVLWAEGMAQAWFCEEHYGEFKKEHPREICTERVVKDGDVSAILEERKKRRQHGKDMEEGETRGERSAAFWKEHWHEMMPTSGRGNFVLQHHWRGLSEEESKLDEEELLKTERSVHGDLRCTFDSALWGFSIFLGTTADVRGGRDLATLGHDDGLEGSWKLAQPREWMTIARKKPFVSPPGGPGSTSEKHSKFFEVDHGKYVLGVAHRSLVELWLEGDKVKGRYLIERAQAPDGRRYWQIVRPKSQEPYAEEHTLEETVKRLKGRGHKLLIWGNGKGKPEVIDLAKWEPPKE